MKGSDEKFSDKIESAKSRRNTVRITLTLGAGTWSEIDRLMTMFEMKQREVFDLCYSFFSKMDFSWVVSSVTKEAEEQIKKTVVISENLNRFLGRESKKEGNS